VTALAKTLSGDLERILALPRRPVVDCERRVGEDGRRVWAPAAQALVEVVTARYSRGSRISCGCRDRHVHALGNGALRVFHQGRPGAPPPPPLETTVEAFCKDNTHNDEAVKLVGGLRSGQSVQVAGLGRPCITELNPAQAWILRELPKAGGVLGFASIGSGKTISGILAPLAVPHVKTVALLAKSDQRIHYQNHYLHLREHFRVPTLVFDNGEAKSHFVQGTPAVHFVSYSVLQQKKNTELLDRLNPDMIVADEAHCISAAPSSKRRGSTRALRFLRYMAKRGDVIFCAWSGSLVNKSLLDVTHLAAHALGLGSPYPIPPDEVDAWSAVIDPSFMPDTTSSTARALQRSFSAAAPSSIKYLVGGNEGVREGLRQRVVETLGVVSTRSASVTSSITIHRRDPPEIPDEVKSALKGVRDWVRPDQEEIVEPLKRAECAREVGSGFFYRWVYPKGEPPELIEEWFSARKLWNKAKRARLFNAEPHLDSDSLCENAAERAWRVPRYEGDLPVWPAAEWPAWAAVKDKVQPDSRAVWINDFLARDAAAWAKEHVGIVWYHSRAFGLKVAELSGCPFHAGGKDAEAKILAEKGDRSIVASISSHSEGRDGLQFRFSKQLVAESPSSGKAWDQLLGRLARQGQEADEIETWVYAHTEECREALRKAIAYAEFDESMSPNESLFLAADFSFEL